MKNIVKMFVTVLIIGISGIKTVQAQNYEGHGLATISAQRETDREQIKANSYKAVFGTVAEAKTVYRSFGNYSQEELMDLTGRDIAYQLDEPFHADRPDDYEVGYEYYTIPSNAWTTFCNENEDGYVVDRPGKLKFEFANPANAWASKNKSERLVMVIKKKGTNRRARLFADCINGIHPIVEQHVNVPAVSDGYGPAKAEAKAEASVVIRRENPYAEVDQRVGQRNGRFPTIAKVAIVVAALAILTKCVIMPALSKAANNNTPHSNSWPDQQGGAGPTPTTGGSGGSVTL